MKIVCSSDWHLDARTAGVERFDEIRESCEQVVDYAIKASADLFVFCGDLCDPEDGRDVLRASAYAVGIARRLSSVRIPSIWIAGNHDSVKDGETTTLEPLRYLCDDNIVVVSTGLHISTLGSRGEFMFLLLPYSPMPYDACAAMRAAADDAVKSGQRFVVFSHLMLPGMHLGSESSEMARGKDRNFPLEEMRAARPLLVVSGHYHRRQTTEDGIQVVGSLARLTFGEESNTPQFLVIELA